MDEVWARVGLLLAAGAVAGVIVLLQRMRLRAPQREVEMHHLEPGLYLFSSATCSSCEAARARLVAELGSAGFEEFLWERDPAIFTDLEIERVPSVLVLREGGRGRVYAGHVERALANR